MQDALALATRGHRMCKCESDLSLGGYFWEVGLFFALTAWVVWGMIDRLKHRKRVTFPVLAPTTLGILLSFLSKTTFEFIATKIRSKRCCSNHSRMGIRSNTLYASA